MTAKDLAYDSHHLITKKWQYFQVINALALAVFLLIVGRSVMMGAMTAGAIFVYFSYFQRLSDSASNGLTTLLNLMQYKVAIERMLPIFEQAPRTIKGKPFPIDWRTIDIEHGQFVHRADGKEFRIEDLNLSFKRGQQVGVVGRSGSGKSTLAKLMLGVYKLDGGAIKIGGLPLDDIDPRELTKHVTIVLQETELFNLTLRQNITMMKNIDEVKLQEAIAIACLQPVIDKLAHGLDTKVGEKGGRLSGGEKQRIGIARAICADTEIMVLDEATSALDSKTELAVQEALENRLQDKTLIIIAHRLMTLNRVDRVVVFDKGRVVEQDAFNELLKNSRSIFAQMYQLQRPAKPVLPVRRIDLEKTKQLYPAPQH
jgi:ABC-type multidrug transport system fused ATPase/permease subunit